MEGAATSYDEEVTPEIDPPLIDPPPAATLLGRIFAHRRPKGTVVRAPLVRIDVPEPPAPEPVPTAPEPVAAPDPAPAPPVVAPLEPPATPPPSPAPPVDAQPAAATRFCPVCADRVAVAADGLHCTLGHRLGGAHRRSRGLLGWLRRG